MELSRDFGLTEIVFILAFGLFYFLYIRRTITVAKSLKTSYSSIFGKLALRSAYFLLFIIALLGPAIGGGKNEVKSIGKDIMICVDLSKSMDAFDIAPTRLEKVKFEMKRIVDAFTGDRIGVIIFSSDAYVQCPITYDQNALRLFIDAMSSRLVPNTGTDFGPPLKMAFKKLTEESNEPTTQPKSKVVIMISDGEDFGTETEDVLDDIEKNNIRLFALGVGTEEGGNIRAGNGLKTDRRGMPVTTKLNSESLKELAHRTDGQYFEISDSRNDVSRLINTIGRIEGELRDSRTVDVTANRYFYFLLGALILFLIDILFNVPAIRI